MDLLSVLEMSGADRTESRRIQDAFALRTYDHDEVVFREGDAPDRLCFIRSGQALVSKKNRNGDDDPLGVLKDGEFFGEIGLLEEMARTATVKAIGALEVLELGREEFRALAGRCPQLSSLLERISRNRLLGQVSILRELDARVLDAIGELLISKTLPAQTTVFSQNDPPDALYIIARGGVRVSKHTEASRDVTLACLGQGDFFGEMGLIEDRPRSATITTTEPSKFWLVPKDDFQALLEKDPHVSFGILKVLSRRLREEAREIALEKGTSFFKGMTIVSRPDRCLSCRSCEIACAVSKSRTRGLHDAICEEPLPVRRVHVRRSRSGSQPTIRPEHCLHCRDAPCLASCKPGAIKRDVITGTIVISERKCKGCGLCAKACPFNVITMIRSNGKMRMALKCTHCAEHRGGPACVRSCPTNALTISLAATGAS